MTIDWEAVGAIGEILGSLGVLITLIYLAAQVRPNNAFAEDKVYFFHSQTGTNIRKRTLDLVKQKGIDQEFADDS